MTEALARAGHPVVVNVDVTLVAERPRIGPYRDAMRGVISALLGIPLERVSVKASSGNGMTGFGRGEGVFASVVVLVEIP